MKTRIFFTFSFIFINCHIFHVQQAMADSQTLTVKISKKVESSRIARQRLGLIIADHEGKIVYQLNDEKHFIPASLTKIMTAAAILERLPVGHQFLTQLLAESQNVSGTDLQGPLYLRGGGDAGFVSESMWFLVNEFLRAGLKNIHGDIVVDDTRFDRIRFDESRDQVRVDRAYDAPVGAMTFNWSAANVFVRATSKGERPQVFVDPVSDYFTVVNEARTVENGKKMNIVVENKGPDKTTGKEKIVVSGLMPVGTPEFVAYKSVTQPDIWAGEQLKQFLAQRGIKVSGVVRSGKAPSRATLLAQNKSKPVAELVAGMMKFSNNYIAEILTKNLAAEKNVNDASLAQGVGVIVGYLREKGIKDFNLENPSGLSRNNKFKPADILHVLREVQSNFKIFPEYLSSLPVAGVDGTLKRRFVSDKSRAQVRAKTGHLAGVAGLAGFASDATNDVYSFVFIYNGEGEEAYSSIELFDQILSVLVNYKLPD